MRASYRLNPETGVYSRSDAPPFPYSDGDEVEERLLKFIRGTKDRSSGSTELPGGIVDWPSYYFLSRRRCNLLRPLAELLAGDVLEIGAGCGALTRYLGETARSVVGVEGSLRRAEIAAARCSGLSNVNVYAEDFVHYVADRKFDAIVLVGVIEYSPVFLEGADPAGRMLALAAGQLAPEGHLLIAIENRLGLKYFAGAPEDHTGAPFQGIEDLYQPHGPLTLGRGEWEQKLSACNLESVAYLYPFPDYKHPQVILSGAAFADRELDASQFIRHLSAPDQHLGYERILSEELVWPVLGRNGMAADMANSFLIVARQAGAIRSRWAPDALAYCYDCRRLPGYDRESRIVRNSSATPVAKRRRLHPESPANHRYTQRVTDEPVPAGVPYMDGLYSLMNRPGWTVAAIAGWAQPWFEYLRGHVLTGLSQVSGELLDCIPSHLFVTSDGAIQAFDLEFASRDPLPIEFVLFRGLLHSMSRIRTCAPARLPAGTTYSEIAFHAMEALGMPLESERRNAVTEMEADFQTLVRDVSMNGLHEGIFRTALTNRRSFLPSPVGLPADHFESQVFWRGDGEDYAELRSRRLRNPISPGTQQLRIELPPCDPPPVELRLDPSDGPGVFSLLNIRVVSAEGRLLWEWDGADGAFPARHEALLVPSGAKSEVAVIMPASDPYLILPATPDALAGLRQGGRLEFQIRRDDHMSTIWTLASEVDALRRESRAG